MTALSDGAGCERRGRGRLGRGRRRRCRGWGRRPRRGCGTAGSGGSAPPCRPCSRCFHRDLRNRDRGTGAGHGLRCRGSGLRRLRGGLRRLRCRSFRRRRGRRLWSLRRRRWCLRRRSAGNAKHHERRAAQKQQTPAMDGHHNPFAFTEWPLERSLGPEHQTHHGEPAPCGVSALPSLTRGRADTNRCQAMGGARAWKRARCDAVKSNSTAASIGNRARTLGNSNDGGSAGTNAPARWISVQMGQQSSARPSRLAGLDGASGTPVDAWALASVEAAFDTGPTRSRCTCPNDSAS